MTTEHDNPWAGAALGALLPGLGAAALALQSMMRPRVDPRAATYCASAYDLLAGALAAIDACDFGKASIALREAERCADEGLRFAPEHTVNLPRDLAYGEDGILIRHSEDRERFERFLANAQALYDAFLVSLPGAARCKACERRIGTGDPCVCVPCRQAAYEATAPSDAVQAYLFDRIAEAETLNREMVEAAKAWDERTQAALDKLKAGLGLTPKEEALATRKVPERE